MASIIDFHTHAFPDELARRAMASLHENTELQACLDGRLASLLSSMDNAGIARSVICCIATNPDQFDSILNWCRNVSSDRIVPFASIHPDDDNIDEKIERIVRAGIKGVKLHPYYQDYIADEDRAMRLYGSLCEAGLIVVTHAGYDFAFTRDDRSSPARMLNITGQFGDLKLVISHLGGWQQWDEAEDIIIGRNIYLEISFSLQYLTADHARRMIMSHPAQYILFGTDSPWDDQSQALSRLQQLNLPSARLELILHKNAADFLSI